LETNYKITCDLFSLPYDDFNQILYAPRLGFISIVNNDLVNLLADVETLDVQILNQEQKAALDYLHKKNLLNGSSEMNIVSPTLIEYEPTMLTLFPTNQCNLRCKYCYASAGDFKPLTMDWFYATNAIDTLINNVKKRGSKSVALGFHGGGEPLFPWELIKRTVEYAEEQSAKAELKISIFSATNGLLSSSQLEWIIQHFSNLNISFDGLPHIQDIQRPLPNGKGSFEFVNRTIKFLDDHQFNYGLRSTISSLNVDVMENCLDYIINNYKTKTIHFEPLFYCGRCKTTNSLSPEMEKFIENFIKCELKAKECGITLVYSGCRIDNLTTSFCGATQDNFALTPDGYLTTCYEVTSKDDPKSDTFFIGKITENGQVEIDESKRKYLNSLSVDNLAYCSDCFAKWHCGGECIAKLGHTDYSGPRGHDRCKLNRHLIKNRLINIAQGNYSHQESNSTNKEIKENQF